MKTAFRQFELDAQSHAQMYYRSLDGKQDRKVCLIYGATSSTEVLQLTLQPIPSNINSVRNIKEILVHAKKR